MYSDITIYANNIEHQSGAALAACKIASRFNGSVTATYTKLDEIDLLRWRVSSTEDLVDKMMADMDQQENDCRLEFEKLSKPFECETIWHTVAQYNQPVQQMLCTDLIVVDQPAPDGKNDAIQQSILNRIILETKRPVMMIPDGWQQQHTPAKITLGWNSSPEAMRAASDALPFMQICEHVDVLCMMDDRMSKYQQTGIYQIKDYLTRKKIDNQLVLESCEKHSLIPQTFVERAVSSETDLIVVGGYGHSRIREVILGGMTDYLIRKSPVPVIFSH